MVNKNKPIKVKVLTPRLMSGETEGSIINLFNIEHEPKIFTLFGGVYEKI